MSSAYLVGHSKWCIKIVTSHLSLLSQYEFIISMRSKTHHMFKLKEALDFIEFNNFIIHIHVHTQGV